MCPASYLILRMSSLILVRDTMLKRCVFVIVLAPDFGEMISIYLQNRTQALKHYETKVDFIRTNLETLQETIQKKQDTLNYIISIIQSKLQAQTQVSRT
jgi:hypothetical protein